MLEPRPWQKTGADFLAARKRAGLFDDPRVGKSGASILAANIVGADNVGVITTRSGVPVWQRAFDQWSLTASRRRIVSWGGDIASFSRSELDVLIVDECHKAANPIAARTRALYGEIRADGFFHREDAAVARAHRVWCLSGTPAPHDLSNFWPMLRSLAPRLLSSDYGPHDVRSWAAFRARYCITVLKGVKNGQKIPVVIGGRNVEELRERIKTFALRRTQAEVGISEPTCDLLPLAVKGDVFDSVSHQRVVEAAEAAETKDLDMMLSHLMRVTGEVKALAVAEIVHEELSDGGEKTVLAYWHANVGDMLENSLGAHGVLRLDGWTSSRDRSSLEERWRNGPERVFLAQMEASGEAIDLSAAANMIIVEPVFRPTTMRQMALRITNVNAKRTPVIRVAVLAGSIDEVVQQRLLSLWAPIKRVLA